MIKVAKKKKKKRVLKLKKILIFLIVILILIEIVYYIIKMPIKNIYISGNTILADKAIIEESHLSNYPSFLLTSSYEIKQNLKKNKYIKTVEVHKKIGNIIEIEIEEYKSLAILEEENQIILSNGNIVDNTYNIIDDPILINAIEEDIFNSFIEKFQKIDTSILRQISQISYSPTEVDDSRFLLYMNDGNLVYITLTKINKLNKYNKIKDKMNNQTGIIYLDSGDYIEIKDNKSKKDASDTEKVTQ